MPRSLEINYFRFMIFCKIKNITCKLSGEFIIG